MKIDFTPEEQKTIIAYAAIEAGWFPAVRSLAVDFIPAFMAFGYGVYSDKEIFMFAGMFILAYAAGFKKFREYKYAVLLRSICSKLVEIKKLSDAV